MDKNDQKYIVFASILGLSLIISSVIVANTFYSVKALANTLSVTGSAKKVVTSDTAKWVTSFSRTATVADMKASYAQMAKDLAAVKKFFKDNGFNEKDLVISTVFMDQDYSNYGSGGQSPKQYILRQTVEIQSQDIDKITKIANNTQKIVDQGVIFSPQAVEYYYTKLPEARIELLGDAVKDATNRANKIAESSGKKVKNLKEASVGVTQVTSVNSIDISDYGSYDTSKIEKEITTTIKATFNLK